MNKPLLLAALLCVISCGVKGPAGPAKKTLKFHEDGTFKIVQFADLHFEDTTASTNTHDTREVMKAVIAQEKPDFIMLGGDELSGLHFDPWIGLKAFMDSLQVPYALIFGNHDIEAGKYEDVMALYEPSEWFLGCAGPEDLPGVGNYDIPIASSASDDPAAVIYCLDSHRYLNTRVRYGQYQWVTREQINWYCDESQRYTAANDGKPLPSVLFIHKALPELKTVWGTQWCDGLNREKVCVPDLNSGLFCAVANNGDVKAIFSANEHSNDFGGMYFDIGLFYCRSTGTAVNHEPGGRVILLHEGSVKIDTWITTAQGAGHYYYMPAGISTTDEQSMKYLPAVTASAGAQGVKFRYWEFPGEDFRKTENWEPLATKEMHGQMRNFNIEGNSAKGNNCYRYEFQGLIKIPATAVYTFSTHSDDGSQVYIDGNLIVNNDNHNGYYARSKVALQEGLHRIKVTYFQTFWDRHLAVYICDKNTVETPIADDMLYIEE